MNGKQMVLDAAVVGRALADYRAVFRSSTSGLPPAL